MQRSKPRRLVRGNTRLLAAVGAVGAVLCAGRTSRALTWDASGSSPGFPTDGPGTWNTSSLNWSNGTSDLAWPNNSTIATFGDDNGAGGVVNLAVPITASGLVFNLPGSGNYNLTGSALTLTAGTVQVNAANPIVSVDLSGSSGLTLSGSGALTLAGTDSYSGTTVVAGGTLIADTGSAISGPVTVVSPGTVSFNASASVASVLNNGTFTISSGQTVELPSGNSFQQAGGTLNINGTLDINGGTFNYSGGSINGTVTMNGSNPTLYLGANVSTGTFLVDNTSTLFDLNSSAIPAGVSVLFQPTAASFVTFEGFSPLTNNGTLKLTSANGGTIAVEPTLVNNGSLTIAATGTPSEPMEFNSTLTNNTNGTAIFNTSATTANVLNNGTFTISTGQTVELPSGNSFQQAGGTLNINGTLDINGGTFNYSGGSINGTVTMNGSNPTLYLGANVSTGTFLVDNTSTLFDLNSSAIPAGVSVLFQPTSASFVTFEGFSPLTNNGTLKLTSANGGTIAVEPTLVNNGSLTIAATGTPSEPMEFDSTLTNNTNGTAIFNTSATTANVLNNGTFTISTGQTVELPSGNSFQQAGGTLNINGTLDINGGTFNYSGGSINGTVTMNGSNPTLYLGANVSTGTFLVDNTSTLFDLNSSAIPAGVSVLFQPTAASFVTFEGFSPLTNNGTLKLTSANGGTIAVEPTLVNNGSLTIAATGTPSEPMEFNSTLTNNTNGTAIFNTSATTANVLNNGTFTISTGQTVELPSGNSFQQAGGTLNINGTLDINGGTFNYSGGSINGTVTMNGSNPTLYLGANVSTGTFLVDNTSTLFDLNSSAIPAGVSVLFQPTSASFVTFEGFSPLTNNGTLKLTSANGGTIAVEPTLVNNGSLTIAATGTPSEPMEFNSTLTNNTNGTAIFNTSATFGGNLVNIGTLDINAGTLGFASSSYVFNQSGGTTTIAAGTTLNLSHIGQFVINGGTINLASSSTAPGSVEIVSVYWPDPSSPANPATDLSFINTLPYSGVQSPGNINLSGNQCTVNIADPAATLTITAEITDGSVIKTGPGTLVLNGQQDISGPLNVSAGTLTVGPGAAFANNLTILVASGATLNVQGDIPNETIANNGTVNFPAQNTSGIHLVTISGLTLGAGQVSTVGSPTIHADRTLLQLSSLTFGGTTNDWQGLLNLTSNDLDITEGSLANVTNQVKQGYSGGTWTGTGGITSSAAADTTHLTALGVIQNNQSGAAIYGSGAGQLLFDGIAPGAGDILVKYTYYGDANLSGKVDASDYSLIDNGYLHDLTGWFNGDFNYDGIINGSDYTLIDNAFNMQGAQMTSQIATSTGQFAVPVPVPEPSGAIVLLVSMLLHPERIGRKRAGRAGRVRHCCRIV